MPILIELNRRDPDNVFVDLSVGRRAERSCFRGAMNASQHPFIAAIADSPTGEDIKDQLEEFAMECVLLGMRYAQSKKT